MPASAVVGTNYTYYAETLDSQASTSSVSYGVGGSGTGPFTIIVVEVQAAGSGSTAGPRIARPVTRVPILRSSTF